MITKDYLMWLEAKGIAEWDEYFEEWSYTKGPISEELTKQYRTDEEWHQSHAAWPCGIVAWCCDKYKLEDSYDNDLGL